MFASNRAAPLGERLRGALSQRTRTTDPVRPAAVTALPDLATLRGCWFHTPAGPGYMIESAYDGGHDHGSISLHRALRVDPARLAGQVSDERIGTCDPRGFLYIDTETTGLGGAGAMVFLAGVARFEGTTLLLRQYLLPSPAYEGGLLTGLEDELADATALVSFNGKSFDLPALEARAILARRRPGWRGLPHLDLLHPNRRLFRGTLPSHRLVQLELALLGFERDDDCPSAEVPVRYFQFQRTGDPTWIAPVLRHNAWDVLSLVALVAHLQQTCEADDGSLQAARASEYAGDWERAARQYEAVYSASTSRQERLEAAERAARAHARLRRHEDAARMWNAIVSEPRQRRLMPYVELAKIAEHRRHDPGEALRVVEQAIALVEDGLARPGPPSSPTGLGSLRERRARLLRRLGRPPRR